MSSDFMMGIRDAVGRIPTGRVATYGQIALLAGRPRAARIVGCLLASSPQMESLPCHRVVYRDGSLCRGDAFGGAGVQRMMLRSEGVAFLPDGRVDLRQSGWSPR